MADTGNGATITFGTSGFTANFTLLGEVNQEIEKLDISHLGSSEYKQYMPADLAEPGEFNAEFQFDAAEDLPSLGVVETITVTYPKLVVTNDPATMSGTGYISKRSTPQLKNNEVQVAKVTVQFDGATGPAFTPEAAPEGGT